MKKFIYYWTPPIIWMGIIFYLSSRQRISVADIPIYNFIIFKTLHMIEYAVLYLLLFRALHFGRKRSSEVNRIFLIGFFFAVLYAVSDEVHQSFVPTREGRLRDVLIDTFGIFLMYSYIKHSISRIRKYL